MKTESSPTTDSGATGSAGARSDQVHGVHHNAELSQHLTNLAKEHLVAQLQGNGQNPPSPAGYWLQPPHNSPSDYHLPATDKVIYVKLSGGETTFHLPANATFDTIRVVGHDLVLVQSNGTAIVLEDAVGKIPNIEVGDVDIPRVALEAAFTANGVQAAEGPSGQSAPSSGGDFTGATPAELGNVPGSSALLGAEGFSFTPTSIGYPPPNLPLITLNANAESLLTLSESNLTAATNGINGSDPNASLTSISGNFSVDFTPTADVNGGTVIYSLSINGGSGAASGFVDSQTGQADVLVQNGNTISGHVGNVNGALAFTISVNANTGVVTFTEDRAVVESQTSNTNPSVNIATMSANVVTLTATITDGLGHSAAASLDLGKQISLTDDGPSIVANAATLAPLVLSEADLTAATNNGVDGTTPNLALTSVTGHFSADFTDTSGADGLKTTAYALSVQGGNGTASGLVDSQTGSNDVLVLNGNTIEGHVGSTTGALAFTISVDATTGDVTFTEDRAVDNNGTGTTGVSLASDVVTLTQTITDNDGTIASANIDLGAKLSITDDGPSIVANAATVAPLVLSEADLTAATNNGVNGTTPNLALTSVTGHFSADFTDTSGADGLKTTAYALSIVGGNGTASGLVDSQTGHADVLVQNGNTITGYVGSATGAQAFTIVLNPTTGDVTFTEDRAVDNNGTSATLSSGLVTLTQTITDNDGTTASANIDLGAKLSITDDGPSVMVTGAAPTLTLSETHLTFFTNWVNGSDPDFNLTHTSGDFSTVFTDTSGADGLKTTAYALSIQGGNGTASGLVDSQSGLADILFQHGNTIIGYVGHTGIVAFTITLDPASGEVTFTENRAVDNNGTGATGVSLAGDVVTLTQTVTDNDGTTASASIDLGSNLSITDDGPKIQTIPFFEPYLVVSEANLTATTNGGVAGSDPNSFLTHATGNFSFAFDDTPGADGLKSIQYALSIGNGGASGLVDSQTHQNDVLVQTSATTITGYVGSQASGLVAFTISVDGFGNVTLTEDRAVVQAQNGQDPSRDLASLTSGAVTLTQTIVDNDGTTTSASLDISQQLAIADDGPSISVSQHNEPTLTVSEADLTATTNGVDGTVHNGLTSATGNFASNFNDTFGADGQAASGATSYALSIGQSHGGVVLSGLTDSQTHQNDVLVQINATTIEGHVGTNNGALAFTITLNPTTGEVTFTEDRSVVQQQNGQDPSGDTASLTSGAVVLTQTITDGDGTSTSASLDIGQQLTVKDDGPSIVTVTTNEPVLTLSESNLTSTTDDNHTPGTNPNLNATSTTGSFANVFSDTFGADGQAQHDAVSYALSLTGFNSRSGSGINSGLVDTLTGQHDYLFQSGNTITAYVGNSTHGSIAFTITLDPSSGNVTFTEDRSVENNGASATLSSGLVTLQQTITDGDGTATSASVDIGPQFSITDDTPTISLTGASVANQSVSESNLPSNADDNYTPGTSPGATDPSVTENFSGAFSDKFGADGPESGSTAAGTSYSLSIGSHGANTGLIDTLSGDAVTLKQISTTEVDGIVTVSGHTYTVFAYVADASGDVTFTLERSVENNGSSANLPIDSVMLAQQITDGDGSVSTPASIDISNQFSITDDHPIIGSVGNLVVSDTDNSSTSGTWQVNFGADGENHTAPVGLAMGSAPAGLTYTETALQVDGHAGFEVQVTGAATYTFYEYTVATASGTEMFASSDQAGQNPFFELTVLANGTDTFHLDTTGVSGGNQGITFSSGGSHDFFYSANGNSSLTGGDYNFFPPNYGVPSNYDVLITAPGFNQVDISNGKMGVDGNQLNSRETLDFSFGATQSAVTIGVVKGENGANEVFEVTIWNASHTNSSTEFISQTDGTAIVVDQTHWQGGAFNSWFSSGISEVDVTNAATFVGDTNLSLTSISEGTQSASIPSTALDFAVTATDGDGSSATANLAVSLVSTPPVAGTGPYAEFVSESGLPQGSNPNPSAIVDTVQVSFTAGSDNANVTLDPSALTTALPNFQGLTWQVVNGVVEGFQGSTEVVSFAITSGATIQAGQTGTVTVTETLLAPIDGNNGGGAGDLGTLNVVATDANNSALTATDQVSVGVIDDKPVAIADVASDNSGNKLSANVVTGTGETSGKDTQGADQPVTVSGVAAGNDTAVTLTTGVGTAIVTALGTLTMAADGSYTYQAKPNESGTDTFTYTIEDADGSTSTTTLAINVNEVQPTVAAATGTVYEAGLSNGSHVGQTTTVQTGTLSFSESGDTVNVTSITLGTTTYSVPQDGTNLTITTAHSTLVINDHGAYTYTLTGPETGSNGVQTPDAFTYKVTDAQGNTNTSTLSFAIVDDKPVANADTASVTAGQTVTADAAHGLFGTVANGGAGDISGADSPAGVTGVVATSNGNAAGTAGASGVDGIPYTVTGAEGTLTLNQDGSFSYVANANAVPGSTDTFSYTITDADGSTATNTLVLSIAAAPFVVYESGLSGGSDAGNMPTTATTTVSFTAGSHSETVTLDSSDLLHNISGFSNLDWSSAHGGTELIGTQNGQTIVEFQITSGTTISAHQTDTVTITETLFNSLQGNNGEGAGDLGTLNVVATDTFNNTTTDHISAGIVDDAPVFQSADHGVIASGATADLVGQLSYLTGADIPDTLAFAGVSGTSSHNATNTGIQWGGSTLYEYVDTSGVLHGEVKQSGSFTEVFDVTLSGSTYNFNLESSPGSGTVTLPFAFNITDSDGSTAMGDFDVTVTGATQQVTYTGDSGAVAFNGTYTTLADHTGTLGNSAVTSATNVLIGGPENDIFISSYGPDTMTGGGGTDIFKLENIHVSDVITDFNSHDAVDLTALLTNVNTSLPASDYVFYNQNTGALFIDPSGSGKTADFHQVATLDSNNNINVHPAASTVTYLYADNTAQHTVHHHTG